MSVPLKQLPPPHPPPPPPPPPPQHVAPATVLAPASTTTWTTTAVGDLLNAKPTKLPETCYIFCDRKGFPWDAENDSELDGEVARRRILDPFEVPSFLSTKECVIHNGYFGCQPSYNDNSGKLNKMSTWFRILVKMLLENGERTPDGKSYVWYEMAFFTRWEAPNKHRILCVDVPDGFRKGLKNALEMNPPKLVDPFALHTALIDEIVKLQDRSVWRLRNPVRSIEKKREKQGVKAVNFSTMHEVSRHAIHISEVLAVTTDTFENLLRHITALYGTGTDLPATLTKTDRHQALEHLSFQVQMIKSLKLRNDSNYERLKSEVQVAYNTIAQQDNTVMKSIALLTMLFLPATFVSAFFSTTFFNFGDDKVWRVTGKIWIYVVVTVPVTVLSLYIWRLWVGGGLRKEKFKLKRSSSRV
ncbi:hypothetical protein B0T10DRAFT_479901 [Thelonectria olida]|uniref:Uncharacterized protein n=1 Tax=Thelonectria olida TaxID=1576542 RepID=A0A9P8W9Q8_9HYPO|nr:hypothetical protein B0T10DRAFT_479901 [Thelonectria olida]